MILLKGFDYELHNRYMERINNQTRLGTHNLGVS